MVQRTPRVIQRSEVQEIASKQRHRRAILVDSGKTSVQSRTIDTLCKIASNILPTIPENASDPTLYALSATLNCWTYEFLTDLVKREQVIDYRGTELCLHVLATNTSLLAWTSLARALLVQSASIVRVPLASDVVDWTFRFLDAIRDADSELANLIEIVHWPRTDIETTRAVISVSNRVMVYGSDETIEQFRAVDDNSAKLLTYGNRLSFGLVMPDSDIKKAADGFALDMAIFDQQGCLSPQVVFVVGDEIASESFARLLYESLNACRGLFPSRDLVVASKIREALELDSLKGGAERLIDPELRFSVKVQLEPQLSFLNIPGGIVVSPMSDINEALEALYKAGLQRKLQGAGIAALNMDEFGTISQQLLEFGVHYRCKPGWLQRPPFDWREDGCDVLKSLA